MQHSPTYTGWQRYGYHREENQWTDELMFTLSQIQEVRNYQWIFRRAQFRQHWIRQQFTAMTSCRGIQDRTLQFRSTPLGCLLVPITLCRRPTVQKFSFLAAARVHSVKHISIIPPPSPKLLSMLDRRQGKKTERDFSSETVWLF